MFDLKPNLLSPEEQLAVDQFAAKRWGHIEELVIEEMRDPDRLIAALVSVLGDNVTTRTRMAALLRGHGDRGINIANIKMDCMDLIREWIIGADK